MPRSGYRDLLGHCAFFLVWGYFIIAPPILPPWVQICMPTVPKIFLIHSCCRPPVKCNPGPVFTLPTTLTVPLGVLYCEHNKGVEHMPTITPHQLSLLKSQVVRKSYSVHHKYHSPAHISFTSYDDAKAYCIKHQLNWKSSWVLTTINHCA